MEIRELSLDAKLSTYVIIRLDKDPLKVLKF